MAISARPVPETPGAVRTRRPREALRRVLGGLAGRAASSLPTTASHRRPLRTAAAALLWLAQRPRPLAQGARVEADRTLVGGQQQRRNSASQQVQWATVGKDARDGQSVREWATTLAALLDEGGRYHRPNVAPPRRAFATAMPTPAPSV